MSENISFEEKLENAKKVLEELSNPELSLAQSMEKYSNGIALLKEASKMIEDAKLEYKQLQNDEK